jgi:hypothetical protein
LIGCAGSGVNLADFKMLAPERPREFGGSAIVNGEVGGTGAEAGGVPGGPGRLCEENIDMAKRNALALDSGNRRLFHQRT